MKKQRMYFKPRFWAILAVILVGGISLSVNCLSQEKTAKTAECEVVVAEEEEKDYLLEIPLTYELQEELYGACEEFGVDYYTMVALIDKETKFENVWGDDGKSYGYCQIQLQWWYELMLEIGATNLTIPKDNFRTACAIIAKLTEKYNGIEGALVAYNQGSYNGNSTPYSREIIENAQRYRA